MTKVLLTRIVEWTAWMPIESDPNIQLGMAHGVSAFQIDDDERVMEVAVTSAQKRRVWNHKTGKEQKIDGPKGPNCETQVLYAFQAVLLRAATEDEVQQMEAAEKADSNGGASSSTGSKLHLPPGYKS